MHSIRGARSKKKVSSKAHRTSWEGSSTRRSAEPDEADEAAVQSDEWQIGRVFGEGWGFIPLLLGRTRRAPTKWKMTHARNEQAKHDEQTRWRLLQIVQTENSMTQVPGFYKSTENQWFVVYKTLITLSRTDSRTGSLNSEGRSFSSTWIRDLSRPFPRL